MGNKREFGFLSSMLARMIWAVSLLTMLASCSGGSDPAIPRFTVGGTVSGLAGSGLVLQNNAGDDLSISADGTFSFTARVANGGTYAVTVNTQPSGSFADLYGHQRQRNRFRV